MEQLSPYAEHYVAIGALASVVVLFWRKIERQERIIAKLSRALGPDEDGGTE